MIFSFISLYQLFKNQSMPFYNKLGNIPHKRHTVFRKPNGELYHEQLFGTVGFDGMSSLMYHLNPPTVVKEMKGQTKVAPEIAHENHLSMRSFKGYQVAPKNDYLESRVPILVNSDCYIELASPKKSMTEYFYKNADADEIIFIHKGEGKLRTQFGNIDFKYGDYLVIPRGIVYQIQFNSEDNRLFIVQSFSPVYTPKRYRNWFGQLVEHSPYCERDIRPPSDLETHDEKGDFLVRIKKQDIIYDYIYATHPFDLIGWDGYNFPYAFSIHDFEPITGRVHLPPPIRSFQECMIIIRMQYPHHITIVILILMKFYIM